MSPPHKMAKPALAGDEGASRGRPELWPNPESASQSSELYENWPRPRRVWACWSNKNGRGEGEFGHVGRPCRELPRSWPPRCLRRDELGDCVERSWPNAQRPPRALWGSAIGGPPFASAGGFRDSPALSGSAGPGIYPNTRGWRGDFVAWRIDGLAMRLHPSGSKDAQPIIGRLGRPAPP